MSFTKVLSLWLVIASLLLVNGVATQIAFIPIFGLEAGEMMGAFIGIAIAFGVSRPFLVAERELPLAQIFRISAVWLVLTIVLEVGLGRTLQLTGPGIPLYDMWDGSFWPVMVLAVASAPLTWLPRAGATVHGVTK